MLLQELQTAQNLKKCNSKQAVSAWNEQKQVEGEIFLL